MDTLKPRKDLKMAVVNVIEAEMTETKRKTLRIYIIKDKDMKKVSKFVKRTTMANPDLYDYFSYVCFRDKKGKYAFKKLSEDQLKAAKKIKARDVDPMIEMNLQRGKYIAKVKEMKPWLGVLLYILYTTIMSSNNYVSQGLIQTAPTMNVWQISFARGAIAFIMMMLKINTNAKKELWDVWRKIETAAIPFLIFRCFQAGASLFIMFVCVQYFPVSTVGIVCCLAHPLTMLLAWVFLDEDVTKEDMLSIFVVFCAVCAIILGAKDEAQAHMRTNGWLVFLLLLQPVLIAVGSIAVKQLGTVSKSIAIEALCSTYQ